MSWLTRLLFFLMTSCIAGVAFAAVQDAPSAALRAKYAALTERLQNNAFQRPLALDSSESSNGLSGSIHARIDYPFATFSTALNSANDWCEVLILHINTKYCRAENSPAGAVLAVRIGKKYSQPIENAYPLELGYRLVTATPEYLEIQLDAAKGPLSTRDYRIRLQAIPVENGRTFLHLTYSYGYGLAGRLAMKTYLATLGSGKVGFTTVGKQTDGRPKYIGGVRGVAERNTMRYYLAIDAYLGALQESSAAAPAALFEKRLQSWYAATERYARQLHEVDRADYVEMKRTEYLRQQPAR